MLFSIEAAPTYTPTKSVRGFPFLHTLSSICYLSDSFIFNFTSLRKPSLSLRKPYLPIRNSFHSTPQSSNAFVYLWNYLVDNLPFTCKLPEGRNCIILLFYPQCPTYDRHLINYLLKENEEGRKEESALTCNHL